MFPAWHISVTNSFSLGWSFCFGYVHRKMNYFSKSVKLSGCVAFNMTQYSSWTHRADTVSETFNNGLKADIFVFGRWFSQWITYASALPW